MDIVFNGTRMAWVCRKWDIEREILAVIKANGYGTQKQIELRKSLTEIDNLLRKWPM